MIRPEPPVKLTKRQRKLWNYMQLHPEVTQFATSAKGTGVARNTVKKHYEMMAGRPGRLLLMIYLALYTVLECRAW